MIFGINLKIQEDNQVIRLKSAKGRVYKLRAGELNKLLNNLIFSRKEGDFINIHNKYLETLLTHGEKVADSEFDMYSIITNLTKNEKKELQELLYQIKKETFYSHGYKSLNGAWSDFEIIFTAFKQAYPELSDTYIVSTPSGYHFYYYMKGFSVDRTLNKNIISKTIKKKGIFFRDN